MTNHSVKYYSVMAKQVKYSGKTTSKIIECSSSPQLIALIKKIRKDDPKYFGSYEISCAIKQFAKLKDYRAAFTLFNDIKNQYPDKLDQSLYSYIIKLCIEQYGHNLDTDSSILQKKRLKALQSAKKLFFEMQHQYNLEPNAYIITSLLSNCSKVITKKSLRMAEHLWNKTITNYYSNVIVDHSLWNVMISVYLKHFKLKNAMALLNEMNIKCSLNPDQTTYLSMINGFRLNCKDLIKSNKDEYIQQNIEQNAISGEKMLEYTVKTFIHSIEKLGESSIQLYGCVMHNFAVIGEIDTCLTLLYFMMEQENTDFYHINIINKMGLDKIENTDNNINIYPNAICFNLCLKSIVCYTELQLKESISFVKPKENKYLEWDFIQNAILIPLKNLEISKELFVSYKLLFQICDIKLEFITAKIKYIVANINLDQDVQNEYLSKEYQKEIIEIFDKIKIFFQEMTSNYKFKPNQRMFDQIYKMGFKFTLLCSQYPALFDNLESNELTDFNEWLITQMKEYGIK